jgi:hypothetical protein
MADPSDAGHALLGRRMRHWFLPLDASEKARFALRRGPTHRPDGDAGHAIAVSASAPAQPITAAADQQPQRATNRKKSLPLLALAPRPRTSQPSMFSATPAVCEKVKKASRSLRARLCWLTPRGGNHLPGALGRIFGCPYPLALYGRWACDLR